MKSKETTLSIKQVLDAKVAKKQAKGADLKITLKKEKGKGTGIYAIKKIKKGQIIAYYRFQVFDPDKSKPVNKEMYSMTVYSNKERPRFNVIGDLFPGSLIPPKNNISFWGYFINEPSKDSQENAYLDVNTRGNYRTRDKVYPGDVMIYKIIASKTILPGEEITWCYGDNYRRNYKTSCAK